MSRSHLSHWLPRAPRLQQRTILSTTSRWSVTNENSQRVQAPCSHEAFHDSNFEVSRTRNISFQMAHTYMLYLQRRLIFDVTLIGSRQIVTLHTHTNESATCCLSLYFIYMIALFSSIDTIYRYYRFAITVAVKNCCAILVAGIS